MFTARKRAGFINLYRSFIKPLSKMYIEFLFFVSLAVAVFIFTCKKSSKNRWHYCDEMLPPSNSRSINSYPVAFFDSEFGTVIDYAEYHPNRLSKWVMAQSGEPCRPYAWFDLPLAPHPRLTQDMPSSMG